MVKKRRLIAAIVLIVATVAIVMTVVIIAGILFFRPFGDREALSGATAVGVPNGPATTKSIGPAGGTLASPDGRLTLTVRQNALTETVAFSIQPITNKSEGGIGLAYRLGPDGATFTTPLELSVRYDDKDLEGTVPEMLSLAYQDQQGAWHVSESATVDQAAKTLKISTTHFTDWSFLAKMRLSPAKAKVHVGETLNIELVGCVPEPEESWFRKAYRRIYPSTGREIQFRKYCNFGDVWSAPFSWFADIGTIEPEVNPSLYQAPPKMPTPNVATVSLPFVLSVFSTGETKRGMFTAHITIVDSGYRATGGEGDVVYSGVICSLDKPFTVNFSWLTPGAIKFVPSSATAGTWSFNTRWKSLTMEGSGSYTIEGADTDKPRILTQGTGSATAPHVQVSKGGMGPIALVPLDTDECNEP